MVAIANEATINAIVIQGMQLFAERKHELTKDSIYCCRMLVGEKPGEVGENPSLAVFILRQEDGKPRASLLLWSEAEERGIAKYVLHLINKGDGSVRDGPGKYLYPEKIPESER